MSIIYINPYQFAAAYDADVLPYITAVEAADGQALEDGVKDAINDFVVGCKNDGIWNAIKACCILAGARTLNGALVPLVGPAPTNHNFVAGDYDRETGLVGDGSTKYLDSKRASDADPQDNIHQSVYITSFPTVGIAFIGVGNVDPNSTNIFTDGSKLLDRNRASPSYGTTRVLGFAATSRNLPLSYISTNGGSIYSYTETSIAPDSLTHFVFARNSGSPNQISNSRLAFYSIGESLDLAALDTRVSGLITAIGAAIP